MITDEKDVIVLCLYYELEIVNISGPRHRCEFEFKRDDIEEVMLAWNSFKPIMIDYRKMIAAQGHFNTLVNNAQGRSH